MKQFTTSNTEALTDRAIAIINLRREGLGVAEIAKTIGTTPRTVEAVLAGENVPAARAHNATGELLPDEAFRQMALREQSIGRLRSALESSPDGVQRLARAREALNQ